MNEVAKPSENGPGRNSLQWPHRVALGLGLVVFPLIWVGGLVTTTDAGMAVPDWPNTFGYNMFLYPWYDWFFGPWDLFVEHGHRLLGTLAGMVAILLVFVTHRATGDVGLRRYSWLLLAMVIVQGALGGARVLMDARDLARLHGCVGPAFFALVAGFVVMTSRWWQRHSGEVSGTSTPVPMVGRLGQILLATSFVQLTLGAFVRHLPEQTSTGTFRLLVWLHVGVAILIVAGTVLTWLASRHPRYTGSGLRGPVWLALCLVGCQFGLGLATWVFKYGWPAWMDRWGFVNHWVIAEKSFLQVNIVTLHAAIGSLILVAWTIVAMRGRRMSQMLGTDETPVFSGVRRRQMATAETA